MQGFPENFKPHPRTNLAYKQFGDSVSVPVIRAIYKNIKKAIS
jgi:DNA (cytosine-5)-methyltransferase 1